MQTSNDYVVGGVRLERPFSIHRLGHVGINVRDIDASLAFYRDVLGLRHTDVLPGPPGVDGPIGHFTSLGSDHHSFVLVDERFGTSEEERARGGMTFNQISFQVGSLAEVVTARDFFVERERKIFKVGRDSPGSNFAVYAFDPDGYRVELFYGMEQIGWNRLSKPRGMSPGMIEAPALPFRAEMQEIDAWHADGGADPHGTFRSEDAMEPRFDVGGVLLPRPFRIVDQGPLLLFVADVDASTRYYQQMYGFELTEETEFRGRRCTFLRVDTHHHTLALVPSALRAEINGGSRSTVLAYGFRLGSYAQLRDAVSFLRGHGIAVETDVHRELHPGIEEAAYITDPDGNRALLYCAMEQIGWDGQPRPPHTRREITADWPQTVPGTSATHQGRTFLGPLG
ncbi:VOC family protein [Streptomyces sp. NPDC090499]|uniref:VOC family protein n=1 Tax=Streptomyces sp. NPDC090499 TaxID=3365965 RepID=UPI00381BEB49